MMKKIINPHNLTDDMMDDIISRVKILPINQNNEILLCKVNGIYHFIGGHIEQNETQVECLKRELNEETGITISNTDLSPFLLLMRYSNNYFNTNKKCLLKIYYFGLKVEEHYNINKQSLDVQEKNNNFSLEYVDFNNIKDVLFDNMGLDNQVLFDEMMYVIDTYKEYCACLNMKEKMVR